jgi:transposase
MTELRHQRALNEKLAYENALLKRMKFAAQSERHNAEQRNLLEDEIDADLAAVAKEIEQLEAPATAPKDKQQPKRQALPANLPRREIRHEPESTLCRCGCQMKRIGEDVAEKLDYVPGVFSVERHVRGKWTCAQCETITQAPVPAHVIDKGITAQKNILESCVAVVLILVSDGKLTRRSALESCSFGRSCLFQGQCDHRACPECSFKPCWIETPDLPYLSQAAT